jgi:hypothetical protein
VSNESAFTLGGDRVLWLEQFALELLQEGKGIDAVRRTLLEANALQCAPPLSDGEVAAIVQQCAHRLAVEDDRPEPPPLTTEVPSVVSVVDDEGDFNPSVVSVVGQNREKAPSVVGRKGATATTGAAETHEQEWPTLGEGAFIGPTGEVVRLIQPHTEADPVAILVQLLVAVGNMVGRRLWFTVEGTRHHMNLFAVLIGVSGKGRKGTSWGRTRQMIPDQAWLEHCVSGGLSSGEGLTFRVRDPVDHHNRKGEVETDPGVTDKRLFLLEAEFTSVLQVMGREGNTLSPTLRSAWDDGNLGSLTKNALVKATAAHISIVGHTTAPELLRSLNATEQTNGFGNRFLWLLVKRGNVLPFGGGDLDELALGHLRKQIGDAVNAAQGRLELNAEARELWAEVYPSLSEGRPGLAGGLTARAEAQALRLASIYALLERQREIGRLHLEAALTVVRYVSESVNYVFGKTIGDPTADEILRALRNSSGGITRTEIRDLFGRNRSGNEIARALGVLLEYGLAKSTQEQTKGRASERWTAVGEKRNRSITTYDQSPLSTTEAPSVVSVVPKNGVHRDANGLLVRQ